MEKRAMKPIIYLMILLMLATFTSANIIGITCQFLDDGEPIEDADVNILIYSAAVGGTPLYNQTFVDSTDINGRCEITGINLTNATYGTTYYRDFVVDGQDLDFGGSEREAFTAWWGNDIIANGLAIGTILPVSSVHVQDGSVLFNGSIGSTPISGTGRRFMWIPGKGAIRAGYALGNDWDDDQIGLLSVGLGYRVLANATSAIALGEQSKATGFSSFAVGDLAEASGDFSISMMGGTASDTGSIALSHSSRAEGYYSMALGTWSRASGSYSLAMQDDSYTNGSFGVAIGGDNEALGDESIALGRYISAGSPASIVIGNSFNFANAVTNNVPSSFAVGFDRTQPTFFVNGSAAGVNTMTPQATLHINNTLLLEPISAAPTGLTGMMYYDSDTNELCFYNSTTWVGVTGETCA